MARPRQPTKILEMRGSYKEHPERKADRANEPEGDELNTKPPRGFSHAQKTVWKEIIDMLPKGVMQQQDRMTIETLAKLMVKFRQKYSLNGSEYGLLMKCLTELGMTPASRSKVIVPKKKNERDGWDDA